VEPIWVRRVGAYLLLGCFSQNGDPCPLPVRACCQNDSDLRCVQVEATQGQETTPLLSSGGLDLFLVSGES